MKRCKHQRRYWQHGEADAEFTSEDSVHFNAGYVMCLDCADYIPFGPTPEPAPGSVEWIQRRAVELAESWERFLGLPDATAVERYGFQGVEAIPTLFVYERDGTRRTDEDVPLNLESSEWLAGHLARCIVVHDREQGGE